MMEHRISFFEDNEKNYDGLPSPSAEERSFYQNNGTHNLFRDELTIKKEIKGIFQDYSWEEKYEWIHQKLLKGDRLFRKDKITEATYAYFQALVASELTITPEITKRITEELEIPCIMSMVLCLTQKRELAKAVMLCEKGIKLNKYYFKPYFLRGKIYHEIKEYDKAKEDYYTALKYCKE